MRQSDILAHPPQVVTPAARQSYFDEGYLLCRNLISEDWLQPLRSALAQLVQRSRRLTRSDGTYDLEAGHSTAEPRLRRIAYLDDLDPIFWDFAVNSPLADLATDLMGPDVRFRECLINFKWPRGGQAVKWHQDIPFYPHTNLSPAQFLVFLEDIGPDQGPLQVVPRSHKGPVFDHYDAAGNWLGYIPDETVGQAGTERALAVTGQAGSVSVHNSATVHGSAQNLSPLGRPVLILGYNACDALPYTAPAYPSSHHGQVVRGQEAKYALHDPVTLRLPPDWSSGYTSIFAHQAEREAG